MDCVSKDPKIWKIEDPRRSMSWKIQISTYRTYPKCIQISIGRSMETIPKQTEAMEVIDSEPLEATNGKKKSGSRVLFIQDHYVNDHQWIEVDYR